MADSNSGAQTPPASPAQSSLLTAAGIILAVAALYLGRDFFIPFALAGLLAFALSPIVNWLKRWRVPRVAAVLVTVTIAFSVIGGLSYVVATQLVSLANSIPAYQQTMTEKVRTIHGSGSAGDGIMDRLTSSIEGFRRELGDEPAAAPGATPQRREPVPVTIEPEPQSPIGVLRMVLGPLVNPLITAGIVVVFVIFVLLEREPEGPLSKACRSGRSADEHRGAEGGRKPGRPLPSHAAYGECHVRGAARDRTVSYRSP